MELNITQEQFIHMYKTMRNEDIQKQLGVSAYHIRKYGELLGLTKKRGRHVEVYKFTKEE